MWVYPTRGARCARPGSGTYRFPTRIARRAWLRTCLLEQMGFSIRLQMPPFRRIRMLLRARNRVVIGCLGLLLTWEVFLRYVEGCLTPFNYLGFVLLLLVVRFGSVICKFDPTYSAGVVLWVLSTTQLGLQMNWAVRLDSIEAALSSIRVPNELNWTWASIRGLFYKRAEFEPDNILLV